MPVVVLLGVQMSYFGYSASAASGREVFTLDSLERRTHLAAGAVDTSFGSNGRVLGESSLEWVGLSQPLSADVAIDSSNRTVVVGDAIADSGRRVIFVARFNRDGSLDNTFDRDGLKLIDFGGRNNLASALSIDAAGRIVVGATAGNRREQFAVARLRGDGALDNTFSGDGMAAIDFGANAKLNDIAIDAGNRIVFAGDVASGAGNSSIAVARMNPSGRLDTTFDTDGKRQIDASAGRDSAAAVVLTSNRIYLGGVTTDANANFAALKLKFDGSLDRGFDGNGIAAVDFDGDDDFATSMIVDSSNRVLLAGSAEISQTFDGNSVTRPFVAASRILADGSLDEAFDQDGRVTSVTWVSEFTPFSVPLEMFRASPQIITGLDGYQIFSGSSRVNLLVDGRLAGDPDTAIKPITTEERGTYRQAVRVAVSGSEVAVVQNFESEFRVFDSPRVVLGGTLVDRLQRLQEFNVARDRHEVVFLNSITDTAVLPNGTRLIGGDTSTGNAVFATSPDGRLVSDFGLGSRIHRPTFRDIGAVGVKLLPLGDGSFYLQTTSRDFSDSDPVAIVLEKYRGDGTKITEFDSELVTDETSLTSSRLLPRGNFSFSYRGTFTIIAPGVLVRPSGEVVANPVTDSSPSEELPRPNQVVPILNSTDIFITGYRYEGDPNSAQFTRVLQRQNADGTLDSSFAGDGSLSNFTGDIFFGQASGKLLYTLGGETGLRRLNLDGSADASFGVNGVAASGYTNFDLDSQGRILAFREIRSGAGDGDVQVLRLTVNGKTDTTFGGGDGLAVVDTRVTSAGTPNLLITPADDIIVTSYESTEAGVKWSATKLLGA